jgi:hypothetical protein
MAREETTPFPLMLDEDREASRDIDDHKEHKDHTRSDSNHHSSHMQSL